MEQPSSIIRYAFVDLHILGCCRTVTALNPSFDGVVGSGTLNGAKARLDRRSKYRIISRTLKEYILKKRPSNQAMVEQLDITDINGTGVFTYAWWTDVGKMLGNF